MSRFKARVLAWGPDWSKVGLGFSVLRRGFALGVGCWCEKIIASVRAGEDDGMWRAQVSGFV